MDYPIDYSMYSIEEIDFLIKFFHQVERAKHQKIDKTTFQKNYQKFRSIISNIAEEKRIDKALVKTSGVSIYKLAQSFK